jgi:hypothetical protein
MDGGRRLVNPGKKLGAGAGLVAITLRFDKDCT